MLVGGEINGKHTKNSKISKRRCDWDQMTLWYWKAMQQQQQKHRVKSLQKDREMSVKPKATNEILRQMTKRGLR